MTTTIFLHDAKTLRVSFPYAKASVDAIKAIGGARWDPTSKTWRVPLDRLDALLAAFGDTAAIAPEVFMAADATQQEVAEPRKPAAPAQRLLWFMDTLVWAGVSLRVEGPRVIGSGGCWTPVLQGEIDKRATAIRQLLAGGWQPPAPAPAPKPAPAPATMDMITDFDRHAAVWEANWLVNEARKQDLIEGAKRRRRGEIFKRIDRQLGLEEVGE